jgi:hypothetical protein
MDVPADLDLHWSHRRIGVKTRIYGVKGKYFRPDPGSFNITESRKCFGPVGFYETTVYEHLAEGHGRPR